ncbi:hypothetical protein ASPFODRAFT_450631 [Aspergillus luchuensis CBS 106.47]|uniref:Uncharacterized protein n=1 Tax=Aspergillus luchuensis (strain CBS 106.47) TaxID=1137211 RepID=A0A1M3TWW7_ASPLC|nr:hypothetical protein ASPFODRAFT_450631 [Aspergillus luchuensis CBS 106.47]
MLRFAILCLPAFICLFSFIFFFSFYSSFFTYHDGALRTVTPPFVIVISSLISSVMFDVMFLVTCSHPFFTIKSYQFTKQAWNRTKCLMRECASLALICLLCLVWIDCVASLVFLFLTSSLVAFLFNSLIGQNRIFIYSRLFCCAHVYYYSLQIGTVANSQ